MKYPKECIQGNKKLSFEDCELAILRAAVDKVQSREGEKLLHTPSVQKIIEIVEKFLRNKKRVCYGGTAINNILPTEFQFYHKDIELPDYDFFSPEPLKDAKALADIYTKEGFTEVEAKSGMHGGTFKVFVNFIPVADITFVPKALYNSIKKHSIVKAGIHYAPPDYLRMAMYLELSRPKGDTSRWEKVLKRLLLLNKVYPLKGRDCDSVEIQRMFDQPGGFKEKKIFLITRDSLINQGVVFFGGFANRLYLRHNKYFSGNKFMLTPDFDVLSEDPEQTAETLARNLKDAGITKVKIIKKKPVGEIVSQAYEVRAADETLVTIYEPLGCHSYNILHKYNRSIKIATIDTMLSFYLAFLYADRDDYDPQRLLCMSEYLFDVQRANSLSQRGILKRFSIDCYGNQATLESIRKEKTELYKELKNKRGSKEYEWYFLRYSPADKLLEKAARKKKRKTKKKKKKKGRTRRRRRRRRPLQLITGL
jgi:hypothetical protein